MRCHLLMEPSRDQVLLMRSHIQTVGRERAACDALFVDSLSICDCVFGESEQILVCFTSRLLCVALFQLRYLLP